MDIFLVIFQRRSSEIMNVHLTPDSSVMQNSQQSEALGGVFQFHPTTMRQFCIDLRLCLQQKDVIGKISNASHILNDFFYWTKLNILLGSAILVLTNKYSNTIIGWNCNNSKYFSLKYDLIFNAQYLQWTYKDLDPHTQ